MKKFKKFWREHELLVDISLIAIGCGLVAGAFAFEDHIRKKHHLDDPWLGLTEDEYKQMLIALNPEIFAN